MVMTMESKSKNKEFRYFEKADLYDFAMNYGLEAGAPCEITKHLFTILNVCNYLHIKGKLDKMDKSRIVRKTYDKIVGDKNSFGREYAQSNPVKLLKS